MKKCNTEKCNMKRVKHKKSETRKECNEKTVQHRKRAT